VDAYLGEQAIPVVMNPGAVAKGERPVTTTTWHRSMERYLSSLIAADLRLSAVEAWTSHRYSEPGPRADAENFARREFPMFLALKAEKPI
jgi:hypothetical protein